MRILLLGFTYAFDAKRSCTAVLRDSERVDELVRRGHDVRCVSLVRGGSSPNLRWANLDMSHRRFAASLRRAFPDVPRFDVAVLDYVWMPVSQSWLSSAYFRNNARVVRTMREMRVPLWVPSNAATRQIIGRDCEERDFDSCVIAASDLAIGPFLHGKDLKANRHAHDGWLVVG